MEQENVKLKQITENVKTTRKDDLKQIEKWSRTTFKEVIFDSETCDWKIGTSTFDKHIFNRKRLAFVIEDEIGNVFGSYVNSKINHLRYKENDQWKGLRISDVKSFIFTLQSNGRQ